MAASVANFSDLTLLMEGSTTPAFRLFTVLPPTKSSPIKRSSLFSSCAINKCVGVCEWVCVGKAPRLRNAWHCAEH